MKHRLIKQGRESNEQTLKNVFKPIVTPLEKLINVTKKEPLDATVKDEVIRKKEEDKLNIDDDHDVSFKSSDKSDDDTIDDYQDPQDFDDNREKEGEQQQEESKNILSSYISLLNRKHSSIDEVMGIRKLKTQGLTIGNSPIKLNSKEIHVGTERYPTTEGLLELLFKNEPDINKIKRSDKENYKKIILMTNAHRKYYRSDGDVRVDNIKFKNIISNIIGYDYIFIPNKRKGAGLPEHMIARKKQKPVDYVYWDDPNELVDRLRLILASQAAGNRSHTNEIFSIIEELREAGIVY